MSSPLVFYRADRSSDNESEGKGMYGCIARGDHVWCYVPTNRAARKMCKILKVKYKHKDEDNG